MYQDKLGTQVSQTIYLVRHGETVWNRQGRLQGQSDSPLTLLGICQAEAIGEALRSRLDGQPFEIHASPLGRTRQTAAIITDMLGRDYMSIEFDDRLMEITLGDRDGYAGWKAMARDFPEDWKRQQADPWHYTHPNGESSQMVKDRLTPVLAERRGHDIPTVIIAHGVVNKILRGLYLELSNEATYALDRPQDAFHHLSAGSIETIEVEVE